MGASGRTQRLQRAPIRGQLEARVAPRGAVEARLAPAGRGRHTPNRSEKAALGHQWWISCPFLTTCGRARQIGSCVGRVRTHPNAPNDAPVVAGATFPACRLGRRCGRPDARKGSQGRPSEASWKPAWPPGVPLRPACHQRAGGGAPQTGQRKQLWGTSGGYPVPSCRHVAERVRSGAGVGASGRPQMPQAMLPL